MWRSTVSLVIILACLLVQAKAAPGPDISLEDLLERLESLEDWKREAEHKVSKLREPVAQQGANIKKLERELAIQANIATTLQVSKQETQQDTHELQAESADSVNDGQISNNRIKSTDNQIPGQPSIVNKRAITVDVAFTVFLDHGLDIAYLHTIPFNKIIINEGNGYNNNTGIFTCPQAGVYLFSFSIVERSQVGGNEIWTELVVNGERIIGAMVYSDHPSQKLQSGNTGVLRLNQGDFVSIDSYLAAERHLEGHYLLGNTFTGVYLHA